MDEQLSARYINSEYLFLLSWTYMDQLFGASSKWALSQISDCLNSHVECRRLRKDVSFTPSRLINVGIRELGEDVVLENNTSIPPGSAYVALSYCWGGYDPDCMTTADSLEDNMRRIPWSKLPATFKDAVGFTRSLGIKYLWIDSICIIQHDKRDWHQQAGLMWDIYKHSYVTLAALYGNSSKSGLRSASMEDELVKVTEFSTGNHRWPVYARALHYLQNSLEPDSDEDVQKLSPLLSRAWAYQERMISPRVLYFTKSEIIFQCFTHSTCECGVLRHDPLLIPKPIIIHWGDTDMLECDDQETLASIEESEDARQWVAATWRDMIVSGYSGLLLTKSEDRLVALSAMTKQFQKLRPNETYLAGLWSGSLIEDLLWRCSDLPSEKNGQYRKDALKRPYAFPTWSWASLQSTVDFPKYRCFVRSVSPITISEASCHYDGHSFLGILARSVLRLRGKLTPATLKWYGHRKCVVFIPSFGNWAMVMNSSGNIQRERYSERLYMDHDEDGYQCIPQQQRVYLLWMLVDFKAIDEDYMTRHYLILRREEEGKDIFSRAGVMEYTAKYTDLWNYFDTTKRYTNAWSMLDDQSVITECEIR
ncbi:hypothetical protein Daesc_008446 [Daldinia eschscholtzii]|uniref:Heterokaryon incompatibility domain-containing protein n=1 Tax=Daldinia eschscholtzii TaxID=292717 RepID=A0AAX6MBU3_9PEZI